MEGTLLKSKKGFTLIEIIVVLVILAILAAASIPTMMGFVEEAQGKVYIQEARIGYIAAQAVATEMVAKNGYMPEGVDIRGSEMFKNMTAELSAEWESGGKTYYNFGVPLYNSEGKITRIDYTVEVGRYNYLITLEAGKPATVRKDLIHVPSVNGK